MPSDIILIGPVRTGKSTLAKLLAERLHLPRYSLDELRWDYYKEIGYDEDFAREIRQRGGLAAVVMYWKQFDAYSVERVLAEHRSCVIDFGAGASVYESDELFARVQRVLAPYPNVVLVLPSAEVEESLVILQERDTSALRGVNFFNTHFLKHHSNYDLAKFIVYTKGRTPEESCDEILNRVTLGPSSE
ncbi:MAG: shikimate kinase [Chloroflexota bacterium]|nr:shikimate kinase [Chloroflexota bacterium]